MLTNILEFFREKKDTFVKKNEVHHKISESGGYCSTCWYPSTYETVKIEEIDWEAFEQAVKELEESFQKGESNSHRNPLNKE